ncbi:hypothetical protein FF36_06322 [Frankia torreyi]|uniref:Uncharacterized protein n=1 Tax=Frankia torreyi TaxID=1856 RepID=A0A0D8B5E4_9ACTN|nr:hypothetical protein [Frankia torreyi]KJE19396.1 hypothetical protein FF36_06322 [Frankia torreyi]KQM01677.1 hypothetical protein FF86_11401 [Frankia sp. CpI1-P]
MSTTKTRTGPVGAAGEMAALEDDEDGAITDPEAIEHDMVGAIG